MIREILFKLKELYRKNRMQNNKLSKIIKVLLTLLGERFPYLNSKDILLVLLFLLEQGNIKQQTTEKFIHALAYHVKIEGIPLPYKFVKKEQIYSEELKMDLNELFAFNYIKYGYEKERSIKLTTTGKERADILLKSMTLPDEEVEIRRSILPIKQLLS